LSETENPRPGPSRPETPNFSLETETFSRDLTSLNMVVNSRISIEHIKKLRGYLDLVTVDFKHEITWALIYLDHPLELIHCVQYWTHGTGNDPNPILPSVHFLIEKST